MLCRLKIAAGDWRSRRDGWEWREQSLAIYGRGDKGSGYH
jgi:hypothetical protein